MSIITLTVRDTDLAAGSYEVDFAAVGNEIDDGRATAAYFTAFYLHTIVNTPDFLEGTRDFGSRLIEGMIRNGPRPMTENPAAMILTLADKDLNTGRFTVTLMSEGGDPTGESLPTTAQVVGAYMRFLMSDMDFRNACWAFAEEFVANHEGSSLVQGTDAPANDQTAEAA
jgi:hypothetical protein